jgi:peptide/nickel transport system substrate-binding protein
MEEEGRISRREFLHVTVLTGTGLLLTGCGTTPPPTMAPGATEAPVAATEIPASPEGGTTLIVSAPATPPSLDLDMYAGTEYEFMCRNLYDAPLQYKTYAGPEGAKMADTGKPADEGVMGSLFESWELAEDGQTYTFHIRKGVKSVYGNELTADDVLWRMERAYGLQASGKFQYDITGITGPEDVTKIDDYTVQFHTPGGPNPIMFKGLCVFTCGFMDSTEAKKHATDADPWVTEWLAMHDAGFGPYHVEEFKAGEQVILAANPNYWQGKLHFDRVIWQVVPEAATRLAMLVAGDTHFADQFLNYEQRKALEGGKGEATLVAIVPTNSLNMVQLQCAMPPFDNVKARQALAWAIPYKDINDSSFFGLAEQAAGHIPPVFADATTEYWKYDTDLDKAKALWDESGAPKEFTLSWDAGMIEHEKAAILIKNRLAEIGVEVTLEKLPAAVFADRMSPVSTMQAWLHWTAAWVPDCTYQTWMWWGDAIFNFKEYRNPEIDRLVSESMVMLDSPERTAKQLRMQEILADEVPSIVVNWSGWQQAANKRLTGLTWYLDSWVRFYQLSWKA